MTTSVYVKTPKGLEEMAHRRHGLSVRERQVLIMMDGKRALRDILGADADAALELLNKLVAMDLLTPLVPPTPVPSAEAAPAAAHRAANEPKAPKPPGDDAERLEMARNFMLNTVNAFLGVAGSSLIAQLEACMDFANLRGLYEDWQDALALTRDGRKQLPELERRLAALLS